MAPAGRISIGWATAFAVLVVGLAECGGGASPTATGSTPAPPPTQVEPTIEAIPEYGGGPGREMAFAVTVAPGTGRAGQIEEGSGPGYRREFRRTYMRAQKACVRGPVRLAAELDLGPKTA